MVRNNFWTRFVIVILFHLFFVIVGTAQTYEPISKAGKGFDVESGIKTNEVITIEGHNFDVYTTKSGSKYVKSLSSKGNLYPVWIGVIGSGAYDSKPVRNSKKGTAFVLNCKDGKTVTITYLKQKTGS